MSLTPQYYYYYYHPLLVDGDYSSWGSWSDCSINCGEGGVMYRYRACDNPEPQYGGLECDLDDLYLRQACNATVNCTGEIYMSKIG